MREITVIIFLTSSALSTSVSIVERCSKEVVVSDVKLFQNETALQNVANVSIYSSSDLTFSNCTCGVKNCFRKCCPVGSYVELPSKKCIMDPGKDLLLNDGVYLHYQNTFKRTVDIRSYSAFVYGKPCEFVYFEDYNWYLQEDGKLYIDLPNAIPPWTLRGPDKYCIDTFVMEDPSTGERTSRLDALICFAEKQDKHHYALSSTCMIISCVFLLATVAVYAWLPELRNLHGKVLMIYLMCLFVGFTCLSTMQVLIIIDNISTLTCTSLTIVIYFTLLSAFFWLNVMSFDIWWTFSGKRGPSGKMSTRARFIAYLVYAFGVPSLMTILLTSLEFSGLPPHPLLPMLRHNGCFIYGTSKLIYFYGPILILCIANMTFFVLTAVKIAQIKKQTSVLKSKESSMHDQHRNDKQRLLLYLKLFAVMGVNWIMEVISALYPDIDDLWKVTDSYNVLIGLIIFIIFVCKRKIFRLIKKRMGYQTEQTSKASWENSEGSRPYLKYKQLRGDPMSRTQTTISSRTLSSRDEVQMGSVKSKAANI